MARQRQRRTYADDLVKRCANETLFANAQHKQAVRIGANYIEQFEPGSARRICEEVCIKHDLTFEFICSPITIKPAVVARQEMMYRLRHETKLSFPQIGRILHRHHVSVINGIAAHAARIGIGVPTSDPQILRIVTESCAEHRMPLRLVGMRSRDETDTLCRSQIAYRISTELDLDDEEIGPILNRGPVAVRSAIEHFRAHIDAHESKLQGAAHGTDSRYHLVSATAGGAQLGL